MKNKTLDLERILSTLKYVRTFQGQTILIKLGGAALRDESLVNTLCEDLALIRSVGLKVILVHGGGPAINESLTKAGIKWDFYEGQRITTPEMMEVIETTLVGKVNRGLVRLLNKNDINSMGFSGTDAKLLECKTLDPKLGRVGLVTKVNTSFIETLLETQTKNSYGTIPVIAPVGYGPGGDPYNLNADWAASSIASALQLKKMIFITDQDGILDENQKLIPTMSSGDLLDLIERGVISGGMLTKVRTILEALQNGVKNIHILNGKQPHALIEELYSENGVGTLISARL